MTEGGDLVLEPPRNDRSVGRSTRLGSFREKAANCDVEAQDTKCTRKSSSEINGILCAGTFIEAVLVRT